MCTSPNRIFYWQRGPDKFTKFTYGEKVHHVEVDQRGHVSVSMNEFRSPGCDKYVTDYYTVGCGLCTECKLKRGKDRASRMYMETISQGLDNAHFVTLTYDDLHLPMNTHVTSDGEIITSHSLDKKIIQNFNKRIRKDLFGNEKGDLRYVAIGEYGDKNGRPHYHIIYWNLPLEDLKPDFEPTQTGKMQYTSEWLESFWWYDKPGDLIGRVRISEVEQASIAYVARYVQKKLYGDERFKYDELGVEPPFILQSKGIGKEFLLKHKDKLLQDGKVFQAFNGESVELTPDRYFRKLMIQEDSDFEVKFNEENEKFAYLRENKIRQELNATGKDYYSYMKVKAKEVNDRTVSLRRKGDF